MAQTDRQTDRPTMSLIELSWTAKKRSNMQLLAFGLTGLGAFGVVKRNTSLIKDKTTVLGKLLSPVQIYVNFDHISKGQFR